MSTKSHDYTARAPRSPMWLRATAATLLATMSACSLGDLSATGEDDGPVGETRASVLAADEGTHPPPLPIPAPLPAPATLPAASLDNAAYVVAAVQAGSAQLDILAGVAAELTATPPPGSPVERAAAYRTAIDQAWALIQAHALNPDADASGTRYRAIGRVLPRIVPTPQQQGFLPGALRAYALAYLAVGRSSVNIPGVQPFNHMQEQEIAGHRFRDDTWSRLHDKARADAAFAQAVDGSVIGTTLQAKTIDAASVTIAHYPVEPLASLLANPRGADGSLTVSGAQINEFVRATGKLGNDASQAYTDVIIEVARAQETFLKKTNPQGGTPTAPVTANLRSASRAKPPEEPSPADKAALEAAIAHAEGIRHDLEPTLGKVESGLSGAFKVLEFMGKINHDDEFVKDCVAMGKAIETFFDTVKSYSETAIKTAKSLCELLDYGETGFKVLGAAIMTGGVVAAVFAAISVFNGAGPDPNQVILEQLAKLQQMINDLRKEMNARFDRIDASLNTIYKDMMAEFAQVHFELGTIDRDVQAVLQSLNLIHDKLTRLDVNIAEFFSDSSRISLFESINLALNYVEHHPGSVLTFDEFKFHENKYFTWATSFAQTSFEAGPSGRSFDPLQVGAELKHPLPFNINYVREFASLLGQTLDAQRLDNPFTWIMSAESYAQLNEEWPDFGPGVRGHIVPLTHEGDRLATALDNITSASLFNTLAAQYRNRVDFFKAAVVAYEEFYFHNPGLNLKGVTVFDGPTQVPTDSFLKSTQLPVCFTDGSVKYPVDLNRFNHDVLKPMALASSMVQHGKMSGCITPSWQFVSRANIPGSTTKHTEIWRLMASVNIHYEPFGGTKFTAFRHINRTNFLKTITVINAEPDPDMYLGSPVAPLAAHIGEIFAPGNDNPVLVATPAQLEAPRTAVGQRFDIIERDLYHEIADKLGTPGSDLGKAALGLDGAKGIWNAFVLFGFPLSVEQNDTLHALVLGGDGILGGSDDDGLLNDVRTIYGAFARSDSQLPEHDLLQVVFQLAGERADTLKTTLSQVIAKLIAGNTREGHELVSHTLLRLQLLDLPRD